VNVYILCTDCVSVRHIFIYLFYKILLHADALFYSDKNLKMACRYNLLCPKQLSRMYLIVFAFMLLSVSSLYIYGIHAIYVIVFVHVHSVQNLKGHISWSCS